MSEQLIDYWKRSRESHGSSSLHLRNNLNNIVGAVSEEFDPNLRRIQEENMKLDLTGGGSAVLENNPLHMNKDVFAFLELISKFNYETARVTRKKLAVDQGRILKRIAHARREADALNFKLSRLKDVDDMTEYEIGCALHESRKWDLDVQGLMEKFDAVDVDLSWNRLSPRAE